jgi:large subunit ribosomal protein L23
MRVPGKLKRYGKYSGYTPEWKKAIVKLSPDSKPLEFFEAVE